MAPYIAFTLLVFYLALVWVLYRKWIAGEQEGDDQWEDDGPDISCSVCLSDNARPGSCERPDCPYRPSPPETPGDFKTWIYDRVDKGPRKGDDQTDFWGAEIGERVG